ncbi:MAG: hypothetical protein JF584_17875 [Acidobacteria bacterium]|nr:hypothetical protein [Acidobacteriota bacterium]
MFLSRSLSVIFVVLCAYGMQAQVSTPSSSVALPGKGLASHDFLYAGESHDRKVFLVRHGKIDWSYDDPQGKGEISDAVLLSNGNLLIAHQYGVKLISPEKKILWSYDPPAGHEVHTAVPIGTSHVLYIENGDPSALLRVVNIVTGAIEKELTLAVKHPVRVHTQFRHARLTPEGTLLVAHMDLNKVVEYDVDGNELWSFPATSPWGVSPLENGNVLITDRVGVREVTRRGDTVWSFTPAEVPEYHFTSLQQAWRLPNGNTVINNWVNEWSKNYAANGPHSIQAIEITPEKKVVWALREWDPPTSLGPSTTIQFLDQPSAPEAVHFGDFR